MQVGAVLVNERRRVVGIGHNSMPYRCGDRLDWAWPSTKPTDDALLMDTKYPYGMIATFRYIKRTIICIAIPYVRNDFSIPARFLTSVL